MQKLTYLNKAELVCRNKDLGAGGNAPPQNVLASVKRHRENSAAATGAAITFTATNPR
jgi:hypothetical protein